MQPSQLWRLVDTGRRLAAAVSSVAHAEQSLAASLGHGGPRLAPAAPSQARSVTTLGRDGPGFASASAGLLPAGGSGGYGGGHRHQGEPLYTSAPTSSPHISPHDLGWLYSLHASEMQQQHFLAFGAAAVSAHAEAGAAGHEVEAELADLADCGVCGSLGDVADFYEAAGEFQEQRQLVLRSSWLCAGSSTLAEMRERLEERVKFLSDLEADGWELEAPVDDQYACMRNAQPKQAHERRLADAWAIVEQWEQDVEWHHWVKPL